MHDQGILRREYIKMIILHIDGSYSDFLQNAHEVLLVTCGYLLYVRPTSWHLKKKYVKGLLLY